MEPLKIRESVPASFRPLSHPAVRLLLEVSVLLALWAALWLLVWGGVLRPLDQAVQAYGLEAASTQAEVSQ